MTTFTPQEKPTESHGTTERLVWLLTPTDREVSDWHRVNQTLENDWNRPLVKVLRFFLADELGDDVHFCDVEDDSPKTEPVDASHTTKLVRLIDLRESPAEIEPDPEELTPLGNCA